MVGQDSRSRAGAGVRIAGPVGTNKRYPYLAAQRAEDNELRKARKAGPLQSRSPTSRSAPTPFPSRTRRARPRCGVMPGCGSATSTCAASSGSSDGPLTPWASRSPSTRNGCAAGSGRAPCSDLRTARTPGRRPSDPRGAPRGVRATRRSVVRISLRECRPTPGVGSHGLCPMRAPPIGLESENPTRPPQS